ncbi:unnamed protein product [Candidula unifasciata]|uniref:Microtubule-associated protein Jupiter n=1 Tax=Candidula unifasciata TaxID=100452 RepID=A0A8S3Z1M2_9EUPU|nr:unnamed protein product [Candidula unifasciata]
MTTTHTFQGLNTDNKPSSRVLNPPGGSSSNIFGASDAQPQARNTARNNSDSSSQSASNAAGQVQNTAATNKSRASRNAFNPITGEPYEQPKPKPELQHQDQPQPEKASQPAGQPVQPQQTARQAAAQNRNQSGIFGGPQEPQEHRSTRVSQPPGGRSTNLW